MNGPRHATVASRLTRRALLSRGGLGLGALALAALETGGSAPRARRVRTAMDPSFGRAKRIVYLHMSGGPPQQELFDPKPLLAELDGQPCPAEHLEGRRFPFTRGTPTVLGMQHPLAPSADGSPVSVLMPRFAEVTDRVCFVHSMHTDQVNHAPAELRLFTGSPVFGGASMGAWVNYGLGSPNEDLPGYVVMVSGGSDPTGGKSLWGSGFLPPQHQGVRFRSTGSPVLFLDDPPGLGRGLRGASVDALAELGRLDAERSGDDEALARVAQYELAFRMQRAVPEAVDLAAEDEDTLELYGAVPGGASFANHCLVARRLLERGVRFVHLMDWGWDLHGTGDGDDLVTKFPAKCGEVDRPVAALLRDLERRGLLDDTLVVWGGEFGRTPVNEARGGSTFLGRDHHPDGFTMWLAGAGVRAGHHHGATDAMGWGIERDPVSVQDLQATILHLLGLDPFELAHPYLGLDQRLIGPDDTPRVVRGILS